MSRRTAVPRGGDTGSLRIPRARRRYDSLMGSPPGHLFGRHFDIDRVRDALIVRGHCVIAGTGGVGKTSVARAVAAQIDRSVVWVEVEPLDREDQVVRMALDQFRVDLLPGDDPTELLVAILPDRDCLLVLDGVEHLAPSVSSLVTRLRSSPSDPMLLVTSRVALDVPDAVTVRLAPLSFDGVDVSASDAADLLFDRILALGGDTESLIRRDDVLRDLLVSTGGLPLAVELTASRVVRVGADLARRGSGQSDEPMRHTVARSLRLLDAETVTLFRRLGISAGTFTIELARALSPDDDAATHDRVGKLVEHGLVLTDGSHFDMLPPLRDHAASELRASGDFDAAQSALIRWGLDITHAADPRVHTDQRALTSVRSNIDALLHLAVTVATDASRRPLAVEIADALFGPLQDLFRTRDALMLLRMALGSESDTVAADVDPAHEAEAARSMALGLSEVATIAEAMPWLDRAERAALRTAEQDRYLCRVWSIRTALEFQSGNLVLAQRDAERAIDAGRKAGEDFGMYQAMRIVADVHRELGELDTAERLVRDVLEWARQHSTYGAFEARYSLACYALERGDRVGASAEARALIADSAGWPNFAAEAVALAKIVLGWADPSVEVSDLTSANDDALTWLIRLDRRLRQAARLDIAQEWEHVMHTAADIAVLADTVPWVVIRITAHTLLGDAALAGGDLHQAGMAYERALRDTVRGPWVLRCADVLDGISALTDARRDSATAGTAAGLADTIRQRCGAAPWPRPSLPMPRVTAVDPPASWLTGTELSSAAVDALCQAIRSPLPDWPLERLTRAEVDVVELVAAGLSNREIGERLFISRRTVESHLSHVFRKLDISNRTQLAALHLRR